MSNSGEIPGNLPGLPGGVPLDRVRPPTTMVNYVMRLDSPEFPEPIAFPVQTDVLPTLGWTFGIQLPDWPEERDWIVVAIRQRLVMNPDAPPSGPLLVVCQEAERLVEGTSS